MRDEPSAADETPPDTAQFQVQFGPDGACRIALIDGTSDPQVPRVIATLTMLAEDADTLGRMLEPERRRAMWQEMAAQAAKGPQH